MDVKGLIHPHLIVASVCDLDPLQLRARGIEGILLDMDNTLAPWREPEVLPEILAWSRRVLDAGMRACVVTNAGHERLVLPVAEQLNIPWVHRAVKPLARGMRRGMAVLDTLPHTTAMVGDQLFTDVVGGNRLGLTTILVNPLVRHNEDWATRNILRPLERLFVRRPAPDYGIGAMP